MEIENNDTSRQSKRVLEETKKLGTDIYNDGTETINELKDKFQEHSDKVVQNVKEKPFTSLLIAAGIGFILSRLLKP
ncbi:MULTISPECIES: hypothetical protein [Legionella]|uniref:DUF883 domain-containing protein n=1 Tax=Legionella drozanskii LLAP-1 TaxID=1212489 RepID=A0A0W0TE62_9GAMM|nr:MULTISPECIES: hypothetical protein [Legionella]KTC93866.1 hypothetical protein Ldro_0216 [Legionella drozanskii LLAP-1]PJE10288.1 MAG: hypothetical protein CK430_10415 [Legionella sp.]